MNDLIEKYKDWLTVNGFSKTTVNNYVTRMIKISKSLDINNLSKENISKYLLEIHQNYKATTLNATRDTLRSFIKFLNLEIEIPHNLKLETKIPNVVTEEYLEKEIVPIIDCIFNQPIKIKAIIYFMFYTGVRVGEVETLTRNNVDLKNRTAKIYIKKGKKEKVVIFPERVAQLMSAYFSKENEITNAFNITTASIKRYCLKINAYLKDFNFYPHLLRHSFATHLRKNGFTIEDIKELMGHKSIQSTMRYAHTNIDDIKKIYDKKIK